MDTAAANNVIAAVGVAIAILALLTSVWTLIMQRKHNRLSAKPLVDVVLGRDKCILELTNCGLGPALLCEFVATIGDESFDLMTDEGLERLAGSVIGVIGRPIRVTPLRLTNDSPIIQGERKPILTLREPFTPDELDEIRARLRRVALRFKSRCLYGDVHIGEHAAVEKRTTASIGPAQSASGSATRREGQPS